MKLTSPTNIEIAQIIKKHGLTLKEFGEAIGYSDPLRATRALLNGTRAGVPYAMTGTAVNSLRYMLVLHGLVTAHSVYREDITPDTEGRLVDALQAAILTLPKRLQPQF